ncbi:MAG: lytic transglycosylase domain-containing protein [Candidatus Adiutrix sp.]
MPKKVTLCGEPLNLKDSAIYERLEFEFIRVVNHPAQVALWQRRASIYFPFIEERLKKSKLPDDLKYLAVAESDLLPSALSHAKALGLWQFIPDTARRFDLTVNNKIDVRHLPEPLMGAAERYLARLHKQFGSWALAMAAYNGGEGRISKAVSGQGTRNYYQLDLPKETERYVYRIAAIKIVMENAADYGYTAHVPTGHYQPPKFIEKQINLKTDTTWPQLAQQEGIDYKTLRILNPHIIHSPLLGDYTLRVPSKR